MEDCVCGTNSAGLPGQRAPLEGGTGQPWIRKQFPETLRLHWVQDRPLGVSTRALFTGLKREMSPTMGPVMEEKDVHTRGCDGPKSHFGLSVKMTQGQCGW